MELNNTLLSFLFLVFGYFFNKYFLLIVKKYNWSVISDNQFKKPQAFHFASTPRVGGLTIFCLLSLSFLYLFLYQNILYLEYITFCSLFFFLGLMDDCKINLKPKFRLLIMIASLIILIISNDFYLEKTGLEFLNNLLEIDIFALCFIILCFLFIINGANLIDGFNGLLGIHTLIIMLVLFFINLFNNNFNLAYILFVSILTILVFIKFNFPKAKMFLGDSGAYLMGALIGVSSIYTSILNPDISPFFFCVLLFYLFFEVFFSFFRKLFLTRQSPLLPDNKHLHMLLFKTFAKNKNNLKSNYNVSIYINLIFFILIIPAVILMNNGEFCRYYFFFLLSVYIYFYKILHKKIKTSKAKI